MPANGAPPTYPNHQTHHTDPSHTAHITPACRRCADLLRLPFGACQRTTAFPGLSFFRFLVLKKFHSGGRDAQRGLHPKHCITFISETKDWKETTSFTKNKRSWKSSKATLWPTQPQKPSTAVRPFSTSASPITSRFPTEKADKRSSPATSIAPGGSAPKKHHN